MDEPVIFAEWTLTALVEQRLTDDEARAALRVIEGPGFRRGLRRAVLRFLRRHPELAPVRVRVRR